MRVHVRSMHRGKQKVIARRRLRRRGNPFPRPNSQQSIRFHREYKGALRIPGRRDDQHPGFPRGLRSRGAGRQTARRGRRQRMVKNRFVYSLTGPLKTQQPGPFLCLIQFSILPPFPALPSAGARTPPAPPRTYSAPGSFPPRRRCGTGFRLRRRPWAGLPGCGTGRPSRCAPA